MTTSSSLPDSATGRALRALSRRRAFTMAELLVVIGIMILLMAILLPMLSKARASAQRISIESDLVGIAQALDQYKHDWGDYPRTTTDVPTDVNGKPVNGPSTGGIVLCWALIAPGPAVQDGAGKPTGGTDMGAPGFRARSGAGKVYGPYLNVDHYRIGTLDPMTPTSPALNLAPPSTPVDDTNTYIADSMGNAILYFPGITNVVPGQGNPPSVLVGFDKIGTTLSDLTNKNQSHFVYNLGDNAPLMSQTVSATSSLTSNILNLQLAANTPSQVIAPFLLISAGHDGRFGPSIYNNKAAGDDDDVAYPDVLAPVPVGTTP